jgi:hypothetical protein
MVTVLGIVGPDLTPAHFTTAVIFLALIGALIVSGVRRFPRVPFVRPSGAHSTETQRAVATAVAVQSAGVALTAGVLTATAAAGWDESPLRLGFVVFLIVAATGAAALHTDVWVHHHAGFRPLPDPLAQNRHASEPRRTDAGRARRRAERSPEAEPPPVQRIPLRHHPGSMIEIENFWPRHVSIRIAAPTPLPIDGSAQLRPRHGIRADRFKHYSWTGRGAADAKLWHPKLQKALKTLFRLTPRGVMSATINPGGIIVQLPGFEANRRTRAALERAATRLAQAIARVAADPRDAGIRFRSTKEEAGSCSCCWEPVARTGAVICDHCGAMQHSECAEWTHGCGRFACQAGGGDAAA